MDNYEWQEAYRPESKFGLYRIDRNTRDGHLDFNRQITKGAEAFKLSQGSLFVGRLPACRHSHVTF